MTSSTKLQGAHGEPARPNDPRAETAVMTLAAVGLPAAALTRSGCVVTANHLMQAMPDLLRPAPRGRLVLADRAADGLLRRALEDPATAPAVRTIPLAGTSRCRPTVLTLLLLCAAVDGGFPGAAFLLIAATLDVSQGVPDPSLLNRLFDLAPAEARLAAALASGQSLKEAAAGAEIMVSTARSYLETIFYKTGTCRQSQLVALLKSTGPLGRASR